MTLSKEKKIRAKEGSLLQLNDLSFNNKILIIISVDDVININP